jgi:class 3 adenylate cyclase
VLATVENFATAHSFLFADLAGFTALTQAHGDEHAADLVGDFSAQVRLLLPDLGWIARALRHLRRRGS